MPRDVEHMLRTLDQGAVEAAEIDRQLEDAGFAPCAWLAEAGHRAGLTMAAD